jgi:uncharacterized membrane protein YcfT
MTRTVATDRPAPSGPRLAWVDAAKGISILLVVAHHGMWFLQTAGLAPAPVVAANTALASLRMPLFFLASGLFVAAPIAAPWRTLLHKRVAFFLYLYALWTLIRFSFFAAPLPGVMDPDEPANPLELVWALLVPGPGMWFLYALAVFSVLAALVRHVAVWLQLGSAAVLSAVAGAMIGEFDGDKWVFMARYLLFFLLGCHARHLVERLARSSRPFTVAAAAVACVAGAAGAVALDLRSIPGIALALNVLAVTFGVLLAAWIARHRIGRPLVGLGSRTLPVYLIHIYWVATITAAVRYVEVPVAAQYALPVLLTAAATALSLVTHRLLLRAGAPWLFALPSRLAHRAPHPQPSTAAPAASAAGMAGRATRA